MRTARQQLVDLIEQGFVSPENIAAAARLSGVIPSGLAWRRFVDRLCLTLGSLALAVSLIFFFAYNWQEMGRLAKFALAQAFIVAAISVFVRWHTHRLVATTALMAAALGVGALLALYGQTYQTGADPWQLFFVWALLILPWATIGRTEALWILVIVLVNVAIGLYFKASGTFSVSTAARFNVAWALFVVNALALFLWEFVVGTNVPSQQRWAPRLIAFLASYPITLLVIVSLTGDYTYSVIAISIGIASFFAGYRFYRHSTPDLFMLALGCLCLIWIILSQIGESLLSQPSFASLLMFALMLIGLGAAAAHWLRKVHREMQNPQPVESRHE